MALNLIMHHIVLIIFCCLHIDARPVESDILLRRNAINHLIRYGYLQNKTTIQGTFNDDNDTYTDQEFQLALLDYQRFMSIPQTGKLNKVTMETMAKPRCGVRDKASESVNVFLTNRGKRKRRDALQHFYKYKSAKSVTYDWFISSNYLPSSNDMAAKSYAMLEYAMNKWSAVTNVNFRSRRGWIYADLVISFRKGNHNDNEPFDGLGGVIAHASRKDMEIHFDDEESWRYEETSIDFKPPKVLPDFVHAAIHEVGHILGLPHSNNTSSVMRPVMALLPSYDLHTTDVKAVQQRYGICWPERIDAIFSNSDGKTYITVGPFVYLFNDALTQVETQSWPRLAKPFFGNEFKLFDDIFLNTDGSLYFFSGGQYYHQWSGQYSHVKRIGKSNTGVVGWPGLNVDRIDAGFQHSDGKVYIFRKDLVYRWDPKAPSPFLPHAPRGQVEKGWPKKISEVFPGLPNDIDSAFRWHNDGQVYFFKGKYFYIWDEQRKKADGLYATHQWKNICDVYLCTNVSPCQSWATRS